MIGSARPASPKVAPRRFPFLPRFHAFSLSSTLVPLGALVLSVGVTVCIALWALNTGSPTVPGGAKAAADSGESGVPFLSDLLPYTIGKEKVKLTRDEMELAKAEAVYKNNMISRWEMMGGALPPHPYKNWNAGKIRSVFLQPTYPCPHPSKIGSRARGKWVCNAHKLKGKPNTIYSMGALEDLSFEAQAFGDWGQETKIHAFSPYLSGREERKLMAIESESSKFLASFQPIGLCPADSCAQMQQESPNPGKEFMTFQQVMTKMGQKKVDILKIDCEGCETMVTYEIGQAYSRDDPPFDQIIIEIHHARVAQKALPVVITLEGMGFRLFHAEAEKSSSQRFELSFVHESFLFQNKTSPVPIYKTGQ